MKRITPDDIYTGLPCSMTALGCALGYTDLGDVLSLRSAGLKDDGYLSLKGMNALIRAHTAVRKVVSFKRGERPALRDFAHANRGHRAVICLLGHFVYFDGRDYHSFFWNGGDPVVQVWYLD